MSWSGEDEYFLMKDPEGEPLWLVRWPGPSDNIGIWSQSRRTWVTAWATIYDEVHDLKRELDTVAIAAEVAEDLKALVQDPPDEVVAAWAKSS